MFLKGIKRKDVEEIINDLEWNKYKFNEIPRERCCDKLKTLDELQNRINKLKEAIKNE